MTATSRADCEALDRDDELRGFRDAFEVPDGVLYLDGNSLGALPTRARERVVHTVEREWREGLIRSWEGADWIGMPQRVGDKIARLIGAGAGEVVATDSTSINVFKALSVAIAARPGRRCIIAERDGFPTDLYMAQGLLAQRGSTGHELVLIGRGEDALREALAARGRDTAAVLLTHVDYRSGHLHDMARITAAAHASGALAIWDLAHSAGTLPVDLGASGVDLAVGCGYKFLNGGPGAPAFIYVARPLQGERQPLSGWMGHVRPFVFSGEYEAAPGIARFLCGTPPVIAMAALEAAVEVMLQAPMEAIRRKSVALGELFIALVEARCGAHGLRLASPRAAVQRGSQVSFAHPASREVLAALTARGVICDRREPDILRFGFAPLYNRFVDVWDAAEALGKVLPIPHPPSPIP